ncbi:hypothetical protein HGRIS_014297 [Hohenbuehelia grisea]|uniref:mRNA export factor GLE1 n=1 Tax=Hohenbuehelia grisea TaxID=104357 RepID=A0ABR3JV66_9AGAR
MARFSAAPRRKSSAFGVGPETDSDSSSGSDSEPSSSTRHYTPQKRVDDSISARRMRFRSPETFDDSDSDSGTASISASAHVPSSSAAVSTTRRRVLPLEEKKYIDETVRAIRLRTRHYDAYEEWEKNTRRDAFRTARQSHKATVLEQQALQAQTRLAHLDAMKARHESLLSGITSRLSELSMHQAAQEARLRRAWQADDGQRIERIERVIKWEEDKLKAKLDEERRVREEAERLRREQAEREARVAEERRQAEEKKKKEEEEKRKAEQEAERKQKEEDARRQAEEAARKDMLEKEKGQRDALGMGTVDDDWQLARDTLLNLKAGPMKTVKADRALKSVWSAVRRQITPKVGQLTDDDASVMRIATTLHDLILPPPPAPQPPEPVYAALLSSLAKAVLLQAETEVTAEKRAARPLARVVALLLGVLPPSTSSGSAFGGAGGLSAFGGGGFNAFGGSSFGGGAFGNSQAAPQPNALALPGFPSVFFAKLVQRAGGWPVPIGVPQTDVDGVPWGGPGASPEQRNKARARAMGYRATGEEGEGLESTTEYSARVAGLMRVYFSVLSLSTASPSQPGGPADLDARSKALFSQPRMWTWFARLLTQRSLLESSTAAQVVHAALDVFGSDARAIWGAQWVKLLGLLYTGATDGLPGIPGQPPKFLGGDAPEGKAARVRVQLEVERIMTGRQ